LRTFNIFLKVGLTFIGEKAVEGLEAGVDVVAEAVMGSKAKTETAAALNTLHNAFVNGKNVTKTYDQDDTFDYKDYGYDDQYYYQDEQPQTSNQAAYYYTNKQQQQQQQQQFDETYRTGFGTPAEHFVPAASQQVQYHAYPGKDINKIYNITIFAGSPQIKCGISIAKKI
jgi:hypothetical protein